MNIVLDNTVEEVSETERNDMGLVVRAQLRSCVLPVLISDVRTLLRPGMWSSRWPQVIRGNAIVMMECLERI